MVFFHKAALHHVRAGPLVCCPNSANVQSFIASAYKELRVFFALILSPVVRLRSNHKRKQEGKGLG